MTLPEIWNTYSNGDYQASLGQSAQALADAAGIDLLHIAGLSMMNLRRHDEGIILLRGATTLRPQAPHMYSNAAFAAQHVGLFHEAAYFADAGLIDFPDDVQLLMCKADSLVMQLRFAESVLYYQRVLEHDPAHVQAMVNLGNICRDNDDFAAAGRWFDQVETIDPQFRDLFFARATMYTQMGEDHRSIKILEQLPNDIDAQYLLSMLYMASGDYDRGFRMYRSRGYSAWAKTEGPPLDTFDHWTEAVGKTIAVVQEGGLGDMLQFVRYIPRLAELAGSVTLFVPPTMIRLFDQLPVTLQSSYDQYDSTDFDYTTSESEMPHHFRTTLDTIPDQLPYLTVPESVIKQRLLPPTDRKRIGLCWAGGTPGRSSNRYYDKRRSFDLDAYAPLGKVSGIEFISLQMGQSEDQTCADLPLLRVLDASFDLLDTAAIIAQLDLVITVDTSIVHLAGAIGKPTWLLSRYNACWRWLHNRPDSPWYPDIVRVFGQKQYGNWSQPIADVADALNLWIRT